MVAEAEGRIAETDIPRTRPAAAARGRAEARRAATLLVPPPQIPSNRYVRVNVALP